MLYKHTRPQVVAGSQQKLRSRLINPIQCSWSWWRRQSPWPAFLHCNNSFINKSQTPPPFSWFSFSWRWLSQTHLSCIMLQFLSLITPLYNLQSCVDFAEAVKYNSLSLCAYLSAVMYILDEQAALFSGCKWKHDYRLLVDPDDWKIIPPLLGLWTVSCHQW